MTTCEQIFTNRYSKRFFGISQQFFGFIKKLFGFLNFFLFLDNFFGFLAIRSKTASFNLLIKGLVFQSVTL